MEQGYNVRTASQLAGLSGHVIRAWEKRYAAVRPARTPGNQRIFSEADVQRLRLLARAVEAGNSIGRIAALTNDELEKLAPRDPNWADEPVAPRDLVVRALDAVKSMDAAALQQVLGDASVELGLLRMIEDVVRPVMEEIGSAWHDGRLRIMHEHMASAEVMSFLDSALRSFAPAADEIGVVVATLSGQVHQIGALVCAVLTASLGFRTTYLGTGLPPEEIVAAALASGSAAVIVSVVFPRNPTQAATELSFIKRHLPEKVRLLVGGASAAQLSPGLETKTIADLRNTLVTLRGSLSKKF